MTRAIKFRAYDNVTQSMGYSEQLGLGLFFGSHYPKSNLMQFTGLLDKNGKEIYEGDILRDVANSNHVVEYDESHYIIRHDDNTSDFIATKNHFEVIGNIYQDPTLIPSNP